MGLPGRGAHQPRKPTPGKQLRTRLAHTWAQVWHMAHGSGKWKRWWFTASISWQEPENPRVEKTKKRGRQSCPQEGGPLVSLHWWFSIWPRLWAPERLPVDQLPREPKDKVTLHRPVLKGGPCVTQWDIRFIFPTWSDIPLALSWRLKSGSKTPVLVTQSCLTLCDPMDCSLPGSSVHGILQATILEWVAIPFSRGSFWPRDWTLVSCIAGRFFTVWAPREALKDLWSSTNTQWPRIQGRPQVKVLNE